MSAYEPFLPALPELEPNQAPPFADVNLFTTNPVLGEAAGHFGKTPDNAHLGQLGAMWGSASFFELGRLANAHAPRLATHDARGGRADHVEFHPAWHELMRAGMAAGLHNHTWTGGSHVDRAARLYMAYQAEAGHVCPLTMTHAAMAALVAQPEIASRWRGKLTASIYDSRQRPWWEKGAVTLGMGMTERQGGTDVRTNTSQAAPAGDHHEITGHKWFMSAPMCDAFLVLAQAPGGLTCFLAPRFRPDGSINALHFQRLKDKLGNRSNASGEVEFVRAFAERIGEEGRGLRTIIGMVQLTRLDCAVASAGLMRFGLACAVHHAIHRIVFQKRLIDQPAMRATLADMALEVEAVTALTLRLAAAFDAAPELPGEAAYARLLTPAIKYYVCKIAPSLLYEAMECHGGNGYVEELPLARAYREAPVNAIWEGSGNVVALDVLRAYASDPDRAISVIETLAQQGPAPAAALGKELTGLLRSPGAEHRARAIAERLARLAAAAALNSLQPDFAENYVAARLVGPSGVTFGCCPLENIASRLLRRCGSPA